MCAHTHILCVILHNMFFLGQVGLVYYNSRKNPSIHPPNSIYFLPSLGNWDQQEEKRVWSSWGGGEEKESVMSNSGESLYKSLKRVMHAGCYTVWRIFRDIFFRRYGAFVVVIYAASNISNGQTWCPEGHIWSIFTFNTPSGLIGRSKNLTWGFKQTTPRLLDINITTTKHPPVTFSNLLATVVF